MDRRSRANHWARWNPLRNLLGAWFQRIFAPILRTAFAWSGFHDSTLEVSLAGFPASTRDPRTKVYDSDIADRLGQYTKAGFVNESGVTEANFDGHDGEKRFIQSSTGASPTAIATEALRRRFIGLTRAITIVLAEIIFVCGLFAEFVLHTHFTPLVLELIASIVIIIWLLGVIAGQFMSAVRFEVEVIEP